MTDKTMKTWTIRTEGDRMEVALAEAPMPEPGPNQVLVKVHAASLNRGEFIAGHGLHKAGSPPKPVGMEVSGEVVKAGSGVSGLKAGDKVMGRCPGAFSGYAVMDAREAIGMPSHLSWEEADRFAEIGRAHV